MATAINQANAIRQSNQLVTPVPELRPKSVPVRFIIATDVAKALAEQLPIAVRMAELQKQRGR
jgi:hypothetical protein